MSGGTSAANICTDSTATFQAFNWLVAKTDDPSVGTIPYSSFNTIPGANLFNEYDDTFFQINSAFNGTQTINALGIAGGLAASVHADANDLVIGSGSSATPGMSILGSTTSVQILNFTDSGSDVVGGFVYDHSTDALKFRTANAYRMQCAGTVVSPVTTGATALGSASLKWSDLHVNGATIYGDTTWSTASPLLTIGDNSGNPTTKRVKTDAGAARDEYWNGANIRWAFDMDSTESMHLSRYNASGVFQDYTQWNQSTGALRGKLVESRTAAFNNTGTALVYVPWTSQTEGTSITALDVRTIAQYNGKLIKVLVESSVTTMGSTTVGFHTEQNTTPSQTAVASISSANASVEFAFSTLNTVTKGQTWHISIDPTGAMADTWVTAVMEWDTTT